MERYHIYKLGLAILFYAVYFARQTVVNGLKIDDVTSTTSKTDYRERRDSGDDGFFYQGADGTPGVDFPTLSYVPRTKFSCRDMEAGYYADLETDCQVFHICDEGRKLSFLCPNGTTFHQSELICDWWFKVNCSNSPSLYEESAEILQRESAKRKDSRRLSYQGTKQGVFSSNQDYGQHTFGGTPAHFVTPSYRTAVKTIDNRISSTTEGIIRSNYNSRGDRTLASFGNGVQEKDFAKTNPFLSGRSQKSSFDNNLQGKLGDRDQTGFSTNTQQKASTVGSFSSDSHSPIKSGSFGLNTFGTTGRAESAGRVTFGTNKQPDSFNSNRQQTTSGRNQNAFGTSSQSNFDGNTQRKSETGKQDTFGTATRYQTDESASHNPDDISSLQTTYEHGQNTFGARLQGGVSKFGQNDFRGNLQGKTETNGQFSFGFDTHKKTGGVASQIPLDGTTQKAGGGNSNTFGRGQVTFGSSTQQTTSGSAGSFDRSSQRTGDGSENLFGRGKVTFGSGTQQTTSGSGTASQIPLDRNSHRAVDANQNIFGGGRVTFGTINQQTVGSRASQIPLDRTAQRISETGRNVFDKGQVTFSAGAQQTSSGSASQIPLDRSSQKAGVGNQNIFGGGRVAYGTNNQQTVSESASQIPFGRTTQTISEGNQNVLGGGQVTFSAGTQQSTSSSASQIPIDRSSQKAGVGNLNTFGGGRVTFGTNNQQTVDGRASQVPFDRTIQTISEGNQNSFGGGRVTIGTNNQQTAGGSLSQKTSEGNQNVFGGQVSFGANIQQSASGSVSQHPLDRNSQKATGYDHTLFGSGQTAFGTNVDQKSEGRDQNRFVSSFHDKTSVTGQKPVQYENVAFGVNVQKTADKSKFNQNLNGYIGNDGQTNILGKESGTNGLKTGDGFDKIKFSITSEGKTDEFDTRKQKSGSDYQQNDLTSIKDSHVTVSGVGQNRFDISSSGKSGKFEQTTSSFGLKSSTYGLAPQSEEEDDDGKIPVLIVSAETQEPQETASFVKSGRNNLLDNNKQGVTNPYPNHRETYSDIKDPRHYYQQPQSKLPEKPFYGSSVSPQVLSTVPVTAYDSSSRTTTEVNFSKENIKPDFELRADISTKQPSVGVDSTTIGPHSSTIGFTAFAPFKESDQFSTGKSPVTTNRFSFGLSTSQPDKSSIGLDLDRQAIEVSTNGEINNFGQTTIQPTTRSATIDSNKVDVTTYDRRYTDGIDVSLNSVSSTLSPDIAEDIEGKSTVYPGSYSTKYYEGKSSTSTGGLNNFGFGSIRTTENPFSNSPIIKLKIQPSTATPEFESSTRSGKSFNVDSPKTQVITLNGSKIKDYRNGPFEVTGNDGRRISVSFGTGQQGPIGTPVVASAGQTVSPGFITVRGNGNGNTFRVITGVNITPTIKFNKFGGTSAGPAIASRSSSTAENEYERNFVSSTPSTKETSFGGKGSNININNHLYTFPESNRDNIGVTLAGDKVNVDVHPSTRATPTEKETFEFTINDEVFTTSTPATISTETITININNENYSTPTSVFSATVQGVSANTVTTASPSDEENASFTSQSSVLQPKPFSVSTESRYDSSKTAVTNKTVVEQSGTQVPPYTISSASPFATTLKPIGDFESNTLTPTSPTPFTTESTSLYSYKPTDENINNMINTLMEVVRKRFGGNDIGFGTPRPGLVVPPSAGPQTLHSLAIYFANALDNLTASSHREIDEQGDDESGTDSPIIHIDNEELIKSLLTQMTRDNYENLFKENDATTTELPFSLRSGADENENDLVREDTKHPTEGPGVRQLARVFTEALSAYLEDPDTFKKVLHDVRPTEPPPLAFGTETTEAEDDEVLNYSDSDLKSDHPHLPSRPTGIPVSPTWGYLLAFNKSSSTNDNLESQNSLSSDKENLQSADSQSFVSQLNKVTQEFKTTLAHDGSTEASRTESDNEDTAKTLPENHWTTSSDVTKLWQTTLSINPALLNENFDSSQTAQGVTSPDVNTRFSAVTSSEENSSSASDGTPRVSEIQYELRALPKLELNSTQVHGILIDFMNTNKTEGSGKLQRILHKLNISQDEFLDKMKEIEGNPLTRRLILLLISECNTDKNKELETRAASSDSVFGLAESKLNSDNTEQPAVTSRRLRSGTGNLPTTESTNFYKHIVHPSLDDDDEDTRALELLNSLYVIASKFGK